MLSLALISSSKCLSLRILALYFFPALLQAVPRPTSMYVCVQIAESEKGWEEGWKGGWGGERDRKDVGGKERGRERERGESRGDDSSRQV